MFVEYKDCYEYLKVKDYKTSSITKPKDKTIVYISKKIEFELRNLNEVNECFVFCDERIHIEDSLSLKHIFCMVKNPAEAFGVTIEKLYRNRDIDRRYVVKNGIEMGENVHIGENTVIEPGVVIGHDVSIGDGCYIKRGSILKNCRIGDNCIIYEHVLIGNIPFNYYDDNQGIAHRMCPSGDVVIGNNVDLGTNSVVDCGTVSSTLIENDVKIDSNCHIAHDVYIDRGVEITGFSVIGAFCQIGEKSRIYSSKILKRLCVGNNAEICFNSCVMKDVRDKERVLGYPAKVIGYTEGF